jgi:hypothetical protein
MSVGACTQTRLGCFPQTVQKHTTNKAAIPFIAHTAPFLPEIRFRSFPSPSLLRFPDITEPISLNIIWTTSSLQDILTTFATESIATTHPPTPTLSTVTLETPPTAALVPIEQSLPGVFNMSSSGQNTIDVDALLDFSACDGSYTSPSLSPSTTSKPTFASPVTAAVSTPSLPSTSQTLSGPSHNYDMYRQQTGFVPGALTNTMAVNQTNNTGYQDFGSLDYLSSFSPENDVFDFNASPSQATMDMDFESPADSQFFSTVNPSSIEQEPATLSQASAVGRLWPGAHSQAALAKAQAQQQLMHQAQRQNSQKARGKAPQPTDPIVEQKITQLLNSMRAKPASDEPESQSNPNNLPRAKKDDEEMDDDERLLASEEGKKLSSKERRQLRNKVSARAFRSRRKGKSSYRINSKARIIY